MKKPTKKLFRVNMAAYKTFYVQAKNQSDALNHLATEEEQSVSGGDFRWEHNETTAEPVPADEASFIRQNHPTEIAVG